MGENQCRMCEYYLQHYAFNTKRIFRVNCGHCTMLRAKKKRPNQKACEHYKPGIPLEERFATKEYLSKELLQYVLHLDLLPEIAEQE